MVTVAKRKVEKAEKVMEKKKRHRRSADERLADLRLRMAKIEAQKSRGEPWVRRVRAVLRAIGKVEDADARSMLDEMAVTIESHMRLRGVSVA